MTVAGEGIVPVEFTKSTAEFEMLLARDILIAKQQNAVIQKRTVYFAKRRFAHGCGDIDVADFGTEAVTEFA